MLCPKSRKKRERLPMGSNEKPKLLVEEDDEGLQRQLRWAYEDYEVVAAKDRATAIDMLRAEEPDVVTLALGLPPADRKSGVQGKRVSDRVDLGGRRLIKTKTN